MRSLLKKEALELLWPVAIVFIAMGWYWFTQESFITLLIAPHVDRCLVVVTIAVVAGAVIGFLQFTAERWRGTLSFVLHRPGGYARVFVAKASVGMSATMVVAVGPVFAFAAWQMLFSENAPLIQSGRLAEYALCGISGWSGHALGMLASQLRRGWWIDISTLVFGTIGVFVATQSTLVPGEESAALSVFIYLAVQAALITCLSWAAFRLMEKGRDRELRLPRGQFGVFATAGLLVYVLPATILVGVSAGDLRWIIPQSYPSIVRELESGEVVVADAKHLRVHGPPEDLSSAFTFRFGSDEETPYSETVFIPRTSAWDMRGPEPSPAPPFAPTIALGPWWTGLWPRNGYRSFETQDRQARLTVFIDRDEGTVRWFWLRAHEPPSYHGAQVDDLPPKLPLEQTFAKLREPNRFSPSTLSVGLGSNSWCLIDPKDSSMWRLALTNLADPFSEVHLPDGDRFVRIEPFYSGRRLRVGLYSRLQSQDLFVGEKGQYVWKDGQFVSYVGDEPTQPRAKDADDRVPLHLAEAAIELRVRQTDSDPIHPRVEVRDSTGERVLLDHTYAPETLQAHALSVLLHAYVLLRMPVMCVASFTKTDDEVGIPPRTKGLLHTEEEPLLLAGRRPWLLCLNLTVAAICVASIVRRMRRQGSSLMAIALAATMTALVGVIAYVYFRGLMPKRASITARSSPVSEARELLIQSA